MDGESILRRHGDTPPVLMGRRASRGSKRGESPQDLEHKVCGGWRRGDWEGVEVTAPSRSSSDFHT